MALKIMLVDDEPGVLRFLCELMLPAGYEVALLSDSQEAAARVDREKFDAVFVDAQMPHLDGFELTRRIRASRSNSRVPVVMLTAWDDAETMRKAFKEGITFFLGKPITPKKLQGLLRVLHGPALRERRRYARLPLRTAVNCKTASKNLQSVSLNISESGMLLERSGGIVPPEVVVLAFSLPDTARTLFPQARAVRTDPAERLAVNFTEVTPDDQAHIQEYVTKVVKG